MVIILYCLLVNMKLMEGLSLIWETRKARKLMRTNHVCLEIYDVVELGFRSSRIFFRGGAKSIVIQISIVMLIFLLFSDQLSGGRPPAPCVRKPGAYPLLRACSHDPGTTHWPCRVNFASVHGLTPITVHMSFSLPSRGGLPVVQHWVTRLADVTFLHVNRTQKLP